MPEKRSPTSRSKHAAPAKRKGKEAGTSPWEWAAAGMGGLILSVILGFLVHEGLTETPGAHPEIAIRQTTVQPLEAGGFLVRVVAENNGDATGANVRVTGTLLTPAEDVLERSTITFDFVARHSRETGGLYFTTDPRRARLVLRAEGYADP